ncbi:hypothetical protein FIV42_07015 [Persicimonas caeni]|uniref:Uncharacterized protein n=1 Tax=Persicimonas caeni TaxID=2292766 RepID=A0A4Y6PQH0_PERCE|nr:hypothetical protein [Persicimonas caeni]QDG50490.1 hypothetical protein FIV42_07015 [Persicimonas caeni]QED31711.1 hypothetical protein FRD00_07010 [Persicimonas caeni]
MDVFSFTGAALLTSVVAYIGPGPGLSMLTALLGLLGTVLLAIVAVFFQPLRILWRKMRNGSSDADADAADDEQAEDAAGEGEDDADEVRSDA